MLQRLIAAAAGLFLAAAAPAHAADVVTPNDAARFLAGMPPSAESPLAPLTREGAWLSHAKFFNSAFGQLEQRQLSKIRAWSEANITAPRSNMFYMFSGPDFLYADAFFPKATTYVLSALEPIGTADLTRLRGNVGPTLHNVERSLGSIMAFSFFITRHMRSDLNAGQVNGALPLLYVFLARSGKTIRDMSLISVDTDGVEHPAKEAAGPSAVRGAKITFAGADGIEKTLYYFSTNLANDGTRATGILKFYGKLAPGDSFIKSASYLLYKDHFSQARNFLLNNSESLVQDDFGIPLAYFRAKRWDLHPFGRYLGPMGEFPGRYQQNLADLFKASKPIDFGVGYRWRPHESNLMLARRIATPPGAAAESAEADEPAPPPRPRKSRPPAPRRPSSSFFFFR